jgi:Caspase domain/Sel1 repeat
MAVGRYFLVWPVLLLASFCAAQEQRGVKPARDGEAAVSNGSYYALVIGINRYQREPSLRTAVGDARAIDAVLREHYGFRTRLLLDAEATHDNILDAFGLYRRTLGENDKLLIYYAGHGMRDGDKAYWLPVDSDPDSPAKWIIADSITTGIRVIPAKHVLIISDSCYSGGLSRSAGANVLPTDHDAAIAKMMTARSRILISSGRDEPVADAGSAGHSVFAAALLNGLGKMDQRLFTALALFERYVREPVIGGSEQEPLYQIIQNSGHEGGDFVFFAGGSAPAPISGSPKPPTTNSSGPAMEPSQTPANSIPPPAMPSQKSPLGEPVSIRARQAADRAFSSHQYYAAMPVYQQLADNGDSSAMGAIGTMYELGGEGVPKDIRIAAQWHLKAAEAGNSASMQSIGLDYMVGDGVPKDYAKAAYWLEKGAEAGQPMAMGAVGVLYGYGRGVPKDLGKAAYWLRKAAATGDAVAKEQLQKLGLNQ